MEESKQGEASKGQDRADLISNLPDPLLHLILSGLPTTEEVVRTSILCTRWRYLWTSVPSVDIDYYRGGLTAPQKFTKNKFKKFVCRVLANKSIDLDSCHLSCGNNYSMSTMDGWIEAAVGRNVKLFDLKFCPHKDEDHFTKLLPKRTDSPAEKMLKMMDLVLRPEVAHDVIELPPCLVTCGTLEELRLDLFGWGLILPNFSTGFRALRALELKTCWFSKKGSRFVEGFLKSCPLLEDLSLVNCTTYWLPVFCISCPKLKSLRMDNGNIYDSEHSKVGYGDMCITLEVCCPKLVYLELVGCVAEEQLIFQSVDSLKKAVIHPEEDDGKLCELLSGISHVESLSLHLDFTMKDINLGDLPNSLPNLKTLELNMSSDVLKMNVVIRILTSSPNIESLHLTIKEDSSSPTEVPDVDYPSGHIFEQLKTVNMTGAVHEIGFIKFLLGNSQVLETMSINTSKNMTDEKLRFLSDDVLKFPRASPEAVIMFV